MLSRAWRLLQHRWFDERSAARRLGPEGLKRIEARIAAAEQRTSGEIRVCVEAGLPWSYIWRHAPARERAVALFAKLGVWDTEQNNGVLVYLLLAERRIEIIADRGIDRRVDAGRWAGIADAMAAELARGAFEAGLVQAIDAVGELLQTHFPAEAGAPNPNELPDAPLLS
jgi:uncharacterized membrane protein